ncbi:MAG: hypothetical protein LUD81_02610, partial [Clostridiales bacterium]|nr:hypothetical protein [Clostridiales bacterium]
AAPESEGVNLLGFLRGVLAIFIMLGGLLGGFYALRDFGGGFGKTFSPLLKTLISYGYFVVPAFLCGLSAFTGLAIAGAGSVFEALNIFVYSLAAAAFGNLIYCFCKSETGLTFALTVLVLAALIFCPIFADTGSFIKIAGVINRLLIPTYYIENNIAPVFVFCHVSAFICGFLNNNGKF